MSVEEELMREIIEMLKGFTIVGAIMLACIYCLFIGIATYVYANEIKKRKKNSENKQSSEDNDNQDKC